MSVRNTVKSIQDIMRQDVGVDGDAQRLSQLCWMFFLKIIDDQDQQFEMMQDTYRSPIPERLQWRTWAADPEGITGDALLAFINTELFPTLKELPITGANANRSRVVRSVFEDAYNYMKSGQLMRQVINRISSVDFNDLAERKHFGDIYEQLLNDLQSAGNAGEYYTPRAVTAFMVDRIDPRPGETLFDPACGTGGFLTCAIRHMREHYVKKVEEEQALQAGLRAVEKKQLPHMLCVTNMLLHGIEDPSFVRHDNTLAQPYISYGQSERVDIILTNPPFGGREEDGIESNFPAHFRTKETADLFLALIIRLLKPDGRAAIVLPDGSLFGEGVKTRLKEHLLAECNLHTIVRLPNSVFRPYASIGTNLLFFEKGEPTREVWFYEHCVPAGQKAYSMTKPIRLEHLQGCVDWWGGAEREGRQETEVAWKVSLDNIKARNFNLDFKNPHTVAEDHGDPAELLAKLERDEQHAANLRDQLKAVLAEALLAMNAERLLQHFERLSEAPYAIPRLRQFILDLAVRGKLVPQDPNDEPAAELLKRIQAEKIRLIKQGTIKRQLPVVPIKVDEFLSGVPDSWKWARLSDLLIGDSQNGYSKKPDDALNGIPILRISAGTARRDGIVAEEEHKLIGGVSVSQQELYRLQPGDLLACCFNGNRSFVGRLSLYTGYLGIRPIYPDKLIRLRLLSQFVLPKLVMYFAESKDVRTDIERYCATTVGNWGISASNLKEVKIPLPPLAEQYRIVAKVDELMALCDQLEARLATTEADGRRLLEAMLHEALAPVLEETA